MHEIERTDDFTLVGADARRGKLTLFSAEREREPGLLDRVVLRVSDLAGALGELPSWLEVEREGEDLALFQAPDNLRLGLTPASSGGVDYDIDHVVLRVPEPSTSFPALSELGFSAQDGRLVVGDKHLELVQGGGSESERPLLNHVALLVDSGQAQLEEARRRGLEVTDIRDTANTFAVFVRGPDGISVEYVEHKPTFSLV
jgi:catechol 2,3-dioxygenase-like lactoylglutathione lyase family enzyme